MHLYKCDYDNSKLFALFDLQERVVISPTQYLNRIRLDKRSSDSQKHIANVIKLHCEWIENRSYFTDLRVDEALKLMQGEDIQEWINFQRDTGVSENTIRNREIIIREMYTELPQQYSPGRRTLRDRSERRDLRRKEKQTARRPARFVRRSD